MTLRTALLYWLVMAVIALVLLVAVAADATIGIDQWRYVDSVDRDTDGKNVIIYRNDLIDPLWALRAESGVAKWNALGNVRIRPASPDEAPTLIINEDLSVSCQQAGGIAGYLARNNDADLITLWPNAAKCSKLNETEKNEVFIHELGHALGLEHQPASVLPKHKKKGKHGRKHRPRVLVRGTTQMLDGAFLGTNNLGSLDVTNYYILWTLCQGDYVCANQAYGLATPECADKNVGEDVGCE